MEISDLIKSARIEKGLTQQQLADVVFVTRQTISKWELGKSVPGQASLILLYQYSDIKDNEKKQLSKLIFNKEAVIDRLTYMSKHRQEYLQDKEHGMITLQFKQGMPVIRFSSGRVTSYWDFSFDGKNMPVQRRCSLSDKIIWGTLLIIDLFILYLFRQSIWLGLAWFCALLLLEVLPFYALESCVTFRHVKMFVTHYLADYIGESEEIYEM